MADKKEVYDKLETLVMGKMFDLESENARLKTELAIAQAKLDVYERIANVSDSKKTLGFGPPIIREGGE